MVDPGALVQGHVTEPSQAPVEAGLARVEETALLRAELKHAPRVTPQVRSVNRGLASGRRISENHQSTDDETRVRPGPLTRSETRTSNGRRSSVCPGSVP